MRYLRGNVPENLKKYKPILLSVSDKNIFEMFKGKFNRKFTKVQIDQEVENLNNRSKQFCYISLVFGTKELKHL